MLLVISTVKTRVKELNPNVTQVSNSFMGELNRKVDILIQQACKRQGSRKTITAVELANGSDYGISPRKVKRGSK